LKFKDGKHGNKVDGELDMANCGEEMGLSLGRSGEAKTEKDNLDNKSRKQNEDIKEWGGG
jgi:hypothetical protein